MLSTTQTTLGIGYRLTKSSNRIRQDSWNLQSLHEHDRSCDKRVKRRLSEEHCQACERDKALVIVSNATSRLLKHSRPDEQPKVGSRKRF